MESRKLVAINGVRWSGKNFDDVLAMRPISDFEEEDHSDTPRLKIWTLNDVLFAEIGDWVIRDTQGYLHICKLDMFVEVYEPMNV